MAGNKKGFSTANADKPQKPMITEPPKTKRKWGIPWGWVAVLIATPFIFQKCSEDDIPGKRLSPNKDTAPAAQIHKAPQDNRAAGAATGRQTLRAQATEHVQSPDYQPGRAPSRVEQGRQRREAAQQDQTLRPTEESEARRAGFGAIFKSLYKLPVAVTGEIDRVMAHRPGDKAIYDAIKVDRTKQFHIAGAAVGADKTINSFICVQEGFRVRDFFHAQATPNGQGGYDVKISEGIPHPGNYMTGRNLMQAFGNKNCDDGLRRLHSAMNGTGETDALNTYRNQRESDRRYNDRGLKAPNS